MFSFSRRKRRRRRRRGRVRRVRRVRRVSRVSRVSRVIKGQMERTEVQSRVRSGLGVEMGGLGLEVGLIHAKKHHTIVEPIAIRALHLLGTGTSQQDKQHAYFW
jgi:hypothetical protein